jgi:plasmid stabilization system protein ParE
MTARPWRLTRQAEAALDDIARWTFQTFGPRQADACQADLIASFEALAAGTAPSRSCRDVFDPSLDARLRLARSGGHVIVFVERPDVVVIVDALHARADLPRRIADALDRDDDA